MTKAELYALVERKRAELGLSGVPVRALELVRTRYPEIILRQDDFGTRAVGGMLIRGPVSLLSLNARRNAAEQNFDCAHELIHYWSGLRHCALPPDGSPPPKQDPYVEWMANEGAAELLMPFRLLLPIFYHERLWRHTGPARRERLRLFAGHFAVTPAMMENRWRSLRRELAQYAETLSVHGVVPLAREM
ncbi:MAG: ImmA/IrrE family metallo-endopeptidase [Oscillospiraceae bacterium]|jgi:Zn-dependent peptidase ImmA (M78 family)|nr:ImmA/IrrE family metallo-endopeptidase [Oscillospiraceae bacterium]